MEIMKRHQSHFKILFLMIHEYLGCYDKKGDIEHQHGKHHDVLNPQEKGGDLFHQHVVPGKKGRGAQIAIIPNRIWHSVVLVVAISPPGSRPPFE